MSASGPFIWAVASAAYQVEGAFDVDGRVKSLWDRIRMEEGRIADGSPPEMAADFFYHWKEDIQLIRSLNVTHFRFSICWSRVVNEDGSHNQAGMNFYKELCEHLKENNIEPIVTLFHADIPLWLYRKGSWLNPEIIDYFVDFCDFCFKELGQFVRHWLTINEVGMHAWCGIVKQRGNPFHSFEEELPSDLQPGADEKKRLATVFLSAHHLILAHAKVYRLYKQVHFAEQRGSVGIVLGGHWCEPVDPADPLHRDAADRAFVATLLHFAQPIFGDGGYPALTKELLNIAGFADILPQFTESELKEVKGSADLIGINYYRPHFISAKIKADADVSATEALFNYEEHDNPKWEKIAGESSWVCLCPEGLASILDYIHHNFGNMPILITENGCMDKEGSDPLRDEHRIRYMKAHIDVVLKARNAGRNVVGYTAWSLTDNLEWDDGFAVRFGLFRVHFDEKRKGREPKESAAAYGSIVKCFLGNK